MNELVYVLTVEAVVFGALSSALATQRLSFEEAGHSALPVFASSWQLLLWYAQALQILCCFLAAGRFASLAPEVRDACARSVGRLCTAAALSAVYVGLLLAWRDRAGAPVSCLLCQLWGTTCARPDTLFWSWSYSAYLALLLPLAALQTGLLVTAAAMCKNAERVAPRRLTTANCALLLAMHVKYSLQHNAPLLPAGCASGVRPAGARPLGLSPRLASFTLVLCALDICTDICADLVAAPSLRRARQPWNFTVLRVLSLVTVFMFSTLYDRESLPLPVLLIHMALAAGLSVLYLLDVWLSFFAKRKAAQPPRQARESHDDAVVLPVEPVAKLRTSSFAFEVEPARRRRFVLAFNNKARWPPAPAPEKKSM